MRFTVLWSSVAERQLAQLWVQATQRQLITRAADEIDQRLCADPEREGESREHGQRLLIVPPFDELSYVEIAQRMAIDESTVRYRLQRILDGLGRSRRWVLASGRGQMKMCGLAQTSESHELN